MARCTKIINPNSDDAKYVINVKQIAKVYFNFDGFTSMPYALLVMIL